MEKGLVTQVRAADPEKNMAFILPLKEDVSLDGLDSKVLAKKAAGLFEAYEVFVLDERAGYCVTDAHGERLARAVERVAELRPELLKTNGNDEVEEPWPKRVMEDAPESLTSHVRPTYTRKEYEKAFASLPPNVPLSMIQAVDRIRKDQKSVPVNYAKMLVHLMKYEKRVDLQKPNEAPHHDYEARHRAHTWRGGGGTKIKP